MLNEQENATFQLKIPLQKRLQQIDNADGANPIRKHIIVLGAGMAGLAAGYELIERGHRVEILEGSNRVGGRVWTHYGRHGGHHEFGAMRIPKSHDYTRHYIKLLGLKLGRFYNADANAFYNAFGVNKPIKDYWHEFLKSPLLRSKLSQADRTKAEIGGIGSILTRYLDMLTDSLSEGAKESFFNLELGKDKTFWARNQVDDQSFEKYLCGRVDKDETKEVIGVLTAVRDLWDTTLTEHIRGKLAGHGEGLQEIIDGMDKLPKGLAERIKNHPKNPAPISHNIEVKGITVNDDHVDLELNNNGQAERKRADYVLCTLPLSVMREMKLEGFSKPKIRAIEKLNYVSSTKVLLSCKKRFWESRYKIFGGASVSEEISRQTYYPSDNRPDYESDWDETELKIRNVLEVQIPESLSQEKIDAAFEKSNLASAKSGNQSGGVLLGSYSWGLKSASPLAELGK